MGNAIAWLALEAGYRVVGHVPLAKFADAAPKKLAAKYERAVKKGKLGADDVAKKVASVEIAAENPAALASCDLIVEARMDDAPEAFRALLDQEVQRLGLAIGDKRLAALRERLEKASA